MKNFKYKKYKHAIILCAVVVLSFFSGHIYAMSKIKKQKALSETKDRLTEQGAILMANRVNRNGSLVAGEVLSVDTKSITLKTLNGDSKVIFFSPIMHIEKTVEGKITEVVPGMNLSIIGLSASDGTFRATSVRLK